MSLLKLSICLALLALGSGLPSLWRSLQPDQTCAPIDADCFLHKAGYLLDARQDNGGADLYYGDQSYDRREAALNALAAIGELPRRRPATVKDLSAALVDGTTPQSTDENLWQFVLRALRDLRGAEAATSLATLDLFETHADQINLRSPYAFQEMLVWLAVHDIERLARLVRYDDIEKTGGEFNTGAEFVRASLLVHECQLMRKTGQTPGRPISDRMAAAALRFSSVGARDMLALGIILQCEGESAARAAVQDQLGWITADNTVLQRDFLNPTDASDPQEAVDQVVWESFVLSFPLAGWLLAENRPADARQTFQALHPNQIAAPLAAIDPAIPAMFDHQFLTWGAVLDLLGRNRLYIASSDLALTYIATEFDPQVRSETRDARDIAQALDLIEAAWPAKAAQSALWRLGQAATNASSVEGLRLATLLRLVALDRTMGCDLPVSLMTEVRDRVEGIGFGGSVMTRIERGELALSAAKALRTPQRTSLDPEYRCIYPQLYRLWQYSPRNIEILHARSLPIWE